VGVARPMPVNDHLFSLRIFAKEMEKETGRLSRYIFIPATVNKIGAVPHASNNRKKYTPG